MMRRQCEDNGRIMEIYWEDDGGMMGDDGKIMEG